ncbi:MAG: ATP-binding cassette domain-containing protein, partial [Thermoleophilaceae bacterium]|nr:ATP-binding cassette domain-containing protein [Thermoleophilaceae bacterium]
AVLLATGTAVPYATRLAARAAGRRQAGARADLSTDLLEIVEGAPEIALAGRESDWEDRARRSGDALERLQRRDALGGGVAAGLGAFACSAGALAVLAVSAPAVESGALAGVLLAAVTLLALGAFETVAPLAGAAARIDACADAALRVSETEAREAPVRDPERPLPCPRRGALELEGLGFRYGAGLPLVLDGASLRVEPGTAVALTGASGAGKSTLGELLVRFRDPVKGRVALDGLDLRSLAQDDVRAQVRLVPQDAYMFATSLRANVALGRPAASDEELVSALGMVGLGDWLGTLPEGLATELGERGERVSGGQRQRIAAARALVAGGRFLVFDEPTAHLDPRSARALLARLAAHAHETGSAVVVITHEREGLDPFDAVLELRDGDIRPVPRLRSSPGRAHGRAPMPSAGRRPSVPA